MSGNSLEDVKKIIKSLVIAQQNGLSSISLNNEFLEVEGRSIPYKSFGANSLTEFLRTLNDIIVMGSNKAGEQVFFARVDSSTAHIANLVAYQRPTTVKRRNNIVRNDEKRPCREPNAINVPPFPSSPSPPPPTAPQPSSPERTRSRRQTSGTSDRRRDPDRSERTERPERRRPPSPMSISPPRRTPTPELDRFRNPSPPRHGRHSSFRDPSPDRLRRPIRDVSPSNLPSSSTDYEKELQRAREKRGIPQQSSRSRRSRTRSPSPRRHRHRSSPPPPSPPHRRRSPPRIKTKSSSCQTDPDKVVAKKLVSVSCQTETLITEKPVKAIAQTSQADGGDEPEDLNAAYYGVSSFGINYLNIHNPYNAASSAPVFDPSFEEDKSQPGHYYDYDAGGSKPIPLIPEYYANWIWAGMVPATGSQQQQLKPQQYPSYSPYPTVSHQQPSVPLVPTVPPVQPTPSIPLTPYVQPVPPEIPMKPTNQVTRDPRLARQSAAAALAQTNTFNNNNNNNVNNNIAKPNEKQSTTPNTGHAKRKALSINDYMKTRKLGPDKSQHIASEESPDKMNNSPDHHGKWGTVPKRG